MAMKRYIWVLAAVAAAPVYAQSPELAAINGAADALGGRAKIQALRTLVIEGAGINPNVGQNRNPDDPLPNWKVTDYRKTIDLVNGRMRLEQHRQAEFPFSMANDVRQNLAVDGDIAFNVGPDGKATRASEAVAQDRRYEMLGNPVAVVRAALDPAAKLGHLRKEGNLQLVDITTAKRDQVTLAIDAATHLPASVRWLSANDNLGDIHNETFFLNYETVSGVKLPRRYLTKIDFRNYTTADIQVSKNAVDASAGNLAAPPDVRAAAPPPARAFKVTPVHVAKGVWWLQSTGNHSSAMYEFDDHLTMYEAPSSAAQARALLAAARAAVPSKPLTEIIISHHHFDHSGGLRTVVAEGLTIISHKDNEKFFRELVARKATLHPDALALHPMPLKFKGVGEYAVLKDNSMEVQLYQLKGNVHSGLNLVAWVPRYRFLSQSDMFDAYWYRFFWTDNYFENLERLHLRFDKDLPVHGRIMTYDEERKIVEAYKKAPEAYAAAAMKFCQSGGPCSGAAAARKPEAGPSRAPAR
jgi:Metallo-beta-lactamase superfamily